MRALLLVLLAAAAPSRSQQVTPSTQDPVRQTVMQALPPDSAARGRDGDLVQFLSRLPDDQRAAALRALSSKEQGLGSDPAVLARLSAAYLALGSAPRALSTAEEVLAQDPRNPDALAVKARVLAARGDVTAARQLLARIPPGHPQAALVVAAIKLSRRASDGATRSDGIAPEAHAPSGENIGSDGGAWTRVDYARANAEADGRDRAPGGALDRGVPGLGNIASEVVANTPMGALAKKTDGQPSTLGTVATAALAATGALMLFGGLGGRLLEEKYPNIRRDMGIAAGISGALAAGAWAVAALAPAAPATPALAASATAGTGASFTPALAGGGSLTQVGEGISLAQAVGRTAAIGGGILAVKPLVGDRPGPTDPRVFMAQRTASITDRKPAAQDQGARQAEYARARDFCNTPPSPGENECSTLSRKIDHTETCIELYEAWDARWETGRHSRKIETYERRLDNLKEEHKRKCVQK